MTTFYGFQYNDYKKLEDNKKLIKIESDITDLIKNFNGVQLIQLQLGLDDYINTKCMELLKTPELGIVEPSLDYDIKKVHMVGKPCFITTEDRSNILVVSFQFDKIHKDLNPISPKYQAAFPVVELAKLL